MSKEETTKLVNEVSVLFPQWKVEFLTSLEYIIARIPTCIMRIENGDNWFSLTNMDHLWWAEYVDGDDMRLTQFPSAIDDSPVRAVLKLILELHKTGDIK